MNALLSRAAQPFGEFLLVFVPCLPLKSQSAALYSVQAPRPPAPVIHPYYTTESLFKSSIVFPLSAL